MSKKKQQLEMDRRKFMQMSALSAGYSCTNPLQMYLATMFTTLIGKAHAQTLDEFSDYKFVNFCMLGGVARWMFDLPLNPQSTDSLVSNPCVITKLNSNLVGSYATHTISGIRMPHMWSGLIARPNNGSVPMSALASNLLITRGIDLQIDSHTICPKLQINPVPSASFTGMAADHAATPIPALSYNGSLAFVSKKGLPSIDIHPSAGNPLEIALDPFRNTPQSPTITEITNAQIESGIDNVLNLLKSLSNNQHKYIPSNYEARAGAKVLMKRNFGNLQSTYTSLQNKYQDLISRSFNDPALFLDGVDDIVVPGSTTAMSMNISTKDGECRYTGSNFNNCFNDDTSIHGLAGGMAFVEYMLVEGLTSSVNVVTQDIQNLIIDNLHKLIQNTQNVSNQTFSNSNTGVNLDMHEVGSHITLILMTKYFRAVASCLYELITALKNKQIPGGGNLFNKVILTISSDFNRSARSNGSGSDHGWEGSSYTLFSGRIPGFEVIGNVTSENSSGYNGTWGKAGLVAELMNKRMVIGNVASTVSTLMDLPSPTPNDKSLIKKLSNGTLVFDLPRGKNVAS